MNTRSLRFQLLSWYVGLLVSAFALFGVFVLFAVRQLLEHNLEQNLTRRAHQIERTMKADSEFTTESLSTQIGVFYAPETSSRFVRILRDGTNVLYQSGAPQDGSFDANVPLPTEVVKEGFRTEGREAGNRILIKSLPITARSVNFLIEVGAPLSPIRIAVNRVVFALILGAPVLIIVAAAGAYKLVGRALSPVVAMAKSAEDISHHNLNERLPAAKSGDELETLASALNRMISRIHEALQQNQRFVADASHELRTPLAILRGELENIINHNHLAPATRETLGSNLEEVERLGKIVESLFSLSRLDSGEAHQESTVFDLGKLAATTTEQMCLLAEDKNIALQCNCNGPVWVRGDSCRLKQLIVNLVDNAIKYTANGGHVDVRTYATQEEAILEINDNGIGIPKTDLPHIFDRFYRVDKTRSREQGGAGLGLSIVKSICSAHQAQIQAFSDGSSGSRFVVRLPLVSDSQLKL